MPLKYKYFVYQPTLNGNEKKYVNECLEPHGYPQKENLLINYMPYQLVNYWHITGRVV